jgi:hypothetical protein
LKRGICIDSTKEFECLFDLRSFIRIDVIKILGQCKSIVAIKIEEYEVWSKRICTIQKSLFWKAIESNNKLFKN